MGTIANSIALYDQMSPVLSNIMNTMNLTVATMRSMQSTMDSGFDVATLEATNNAIAECNAAYTRMQDEIGDAAKNQAQFNQAVSSGNVQVGGLVKSLMGMAGAYVSIQGAKKVLDASDELISTTARLDMMNDGLQTTEELVQAVYSAAQNARGSFSDMASVVAKFGNNAGDAFGSSQEVVEFANLIQKQMAIAGASTAEASNAMLQLSQALGSGVLRGDELNSIFEQAPNLIQSIATYLDVPIGQIREMAQAGQLSADVVKAAIFSAADDINAAFEQMPMTWTQVWTSMQNSALMAFQPVLQELNNIANSPAFQEGIQTILNGFSRISSAVLSVIQFVQQNWNIIRPILLGVIGIIGAYTAAVVVNTIAKKLNAIAAFIQEVQAYKAAAAMQAEAIANANAALAAGNAATADMWLATATQVATTAQYGFNAALLASPITWIVLAIIGAIVAVYSLAKAFSGAGHTAQTAFGAIGGAIFVVGGFFKNLGLTVANIALGIWNALKAVAHNFGVVFETVIDSVKGFFYGFLSTVLSVVDAICGALNKIPFINFDYSGVTNAANDFANKQAELAGKQRNFEDVGAAFGSGFSTFDTWQSGWVNDSYAAGAAWGDGLGNSVESMFDMMGSYGDIAALEDIAIATDATASNTSRYADVSEENLKYLRDIAEQETINRFTTAEIRVDMTNNNNVSSNIDIDGMVERLTEGVNEAMSMAAEGVYM